MSEAREIIRNLYAKLLSITKQSVDEREAAISEIKHHVPDIRRVIVVRHENNVTSASEKLIDELSTDDISSAESITLLDTDVRYEDIINREFFARLRYNHLESLGVKHYSDNTPYYQLDEKETIAIQTLDEDEIRYMGELQTNYIFKIDDYYFRPNGPFVMNENIHLRYYTSSLK